MICIQVVVRFLTMLWCDWQVCADTLIGSDQVRGVSGGQRKRVTTGHRPPSCLLSFLVLFPRGKTV